MQKKKKEKEKKRKEKQQQKNLLIAPLRVNVLAKYAEVERRPILCASTLSMCYKK